MFGSAFSYAGLICFGFRARLDLCTRRKEDGTNVEFEKTIDAQDLPAAVSRALKTKNPRSTFRKAGEIIKKEDPECYQVLLVTADKKKVEVSVSPEGKIANVEKGRQKGVRTHFRSWSRKT